MIDKYNARPCSCLEQLRIQGLFKSSCITPAFRAKTFENYILDGRSETVKTMFNCAKGYLDKFEKVRENENNWLVLLGQPGSGKTHLTMAVANGLIKQSIPTLYFQHVEGIKEMIGMINDNTIQAKKEEMKIVPVLVWDDLFKPSVKDKPPTGFEVEIAFEILNYRYLNLLPTIISSERTPGQLLNIDEAGGSRIIERGSGHMVLIQGQENNYRLL